MPTDSLCTSGEGTMWLNGLGTAAAIRLSAALSRPSCSTAAVRVRDIKIAQVLELLHLSLGSESHLLARF